MLAAFDLYGAGDDRLCYCKAWCNGCCDGADNATCWSYDGGADDSLDTFPIHGVGGTVGGLLTGVFATKVVNAAGADGLVGGQVVDLESEGKPDITVETLTYIHNHKTGALFKSAVACGAILGGATEPEIEKLTKFAHNIGLAFQIIDDILDITATQAELGKTAGKDIEAQKATYPKLWGLEESKRQADKLVAEAKIILAEFGDRARPLQALADYITDRKN